MAKKLLYQVQRTGKTYWREILALLFLLVGIFFFRSERRELRSLEEQIGGANALWVWLGVRCNRSLYSVTKRMYVTSFKGHFHTAFMGQCH
jgi:phosphatidylglycerol lysyltransferase